MSEGIYAKPQRRHRLERRARQRAREPRPHGGGARRRADASRHLLPDPFARRDRRREPWTRENAPRADAIVTRVPGLAVGVAHRRLRAGPVRRRARPAWSAPRMPAGRARSPACSKRRSRRWRSSAPQRARIVAAIGPLIRQPNYEVGAGIRRALHGGRRRERPLLRAAARDRPRDVRPARLHQVAARTR